MREGERLDALAEGLRILQRSGAFCFGTDAVLLADFAAARPGDRVVDMGCGTGVISLLMASRQPLAQFDAIEIQPDMADMALRSVALNGLQDRIRVHHADFQQGDTLLGRESRTLAVCNPPYGKAGGTLVSERDCQRIARHEGDCTIEGIAAAASKMLRVGGRMALIYPAPRMLELMCALRRARLEPKRVRTVHGAPGRAPKLVLLDAVKGGGSQLHWMEPLVLADEAGNPSAEWRRIYRVE
ncbi:MAG: tRNA1(Val) (adenine(37)-N6)-methyltransferase [Clostridiales bacterium]|nr:tRNA1(Val) (adenine(37)-N6)-methyltransferase [Clostridiales bacterium]